MSTQKTAIQPDNSGIRIRLDATPDSVATPLDDLRDFIREGYKGVSANATYLRYLEDMLVAGNGLSLATQNDGGDETLLLSASIDNIDVDGTAGEALALRDMVYLNEADGEWYKQDSDTTASVKMGRIRGCVVESSGIAEDASGAIRLYGTVTGFTSLTAWAMVYASTTAGGYTQTKPFTLSDGSQMIVSEMGYAISTTAMMIEAGRLSYRKRDTVANGGTLTVEHHADSVPYEREIVALSTAEGGTLTDHADTNHDAHHPINGPTDTGTGGMNFDFTGASSGGSPIIGTDNSDVTWAQAYRREVSVNHGILTKLAFTFGANQGTPSGTMTWEIRLTSNGAPIATGTFTPTPSAVNEVDVGDGIFIEDSPDLFIALIPTSTQATNTYWRSQRTVNDGSNSIYFSNNEGTTFTFNNDKDMLVRMVVIDSADKSELAQSFQIASASPISKVRLYLRKFGSPTGNLTVKIVNDDSSSPDETPSLESTSNVVAASSLTTSWAWYDFVFDNPPSLSGSTPYWIVLETTDSQSDTNYVSWAFQYDSPGYANGSFQQYEGSWAEITPGDAIFEVIGVGQSTQALLDDWGSALATILARHDDGAGSDGTTKTTIKNNTGSEAVLELAVAFEGTER